MTSLPATDAKSAAVTARFGYALSIAGTLVSRLATLAVLIILPKQIGLTDYGMFALVITLGEIIEMTSSNWYRLLLVRQTLGAEPASQEGSRSERRGFTLLTLIIFAALLGLGGALVISPLVATHDRQNFTLAVACYILAFIMFRLLVTMLQAQGLAQLIGIVELARGILTLALVFAAVRFGSATFLAASFGLIAATALAALLGLPTIRHGIIAIMRQRVPPGLLVTIGVPIVIATLLTYQIGWLDRVVIQHWMGPEAVGLYVAAIAIARQPVDLVLNALNSQTFPILMEHGADNSPQSARRMSGVLLSTCIMGFGAAASIIALAEPLTLFALPAFDRTTVTTVVPMIALGSVALGLKHFVFDNIFHAHGRNWIALRWLAIVSFATLGLALALVPALGTKGAAISFLTGSCLSLASSVWFSHQFCVVKWPLGALARVIVSALIAAILARVCSGFEGAAWLRLLAGASAFGLAYLLALTVILKFRLGTFLTAPWNIDGLRGTAS